MGRGVFGPFFLLVDTVDTVNYKGCKWQHVYNNSVGKCNFKIVAIDIMFLGIYSSDASTQTKFDFYFHGCGHVAAINRGSFFEQCPEGK